MSLKKEFVIAGILTLLGLVASGFVGHFYNPGLAGVLQALFLVTVLSLLEISISFDNAVVNATVLKDMTPLWQQRFLTWGILIAVFGMRLILPVGVVSAVGGLNPWEALRLAAFNPQKYADLMLSIHHEVAAFGGSFLLLVALKYFIDHEKELHWISVIEKPLSAIGRLEAVQVGIAIAFLLIFSRFIPEDEQLPFLYAGLAGVLIFLFVQGLTVFLSRPSLEADIHRTSAGLFIYLEVLDASFSFDGVIGGFAITNNLFYITIGLGIGALYVRSLTLLMLRKGTLEAFKYLEHGAFYAVFALAAIMFLNTLTHIPELISGLVGIVFIGLSVFASVREKRGLG